MSLLEFPFDGLNPIGVTWPVVRTPVQKTLVQTAVSGKEYRTALQQYPRWKWKMDMGYLFDDHSIPSATANYMFQTLAGFFNQVGGQYQPWFYFDRFENSVTGQGTGTGNGTQTTFPLYKSQIGGPLEPVQAVGTFTVYVNGTPTSVTSTGPPVTITFGSAPANGAAITWTGNFFYICRFTADSYDFSHDFYGIYTAKDIEFISVFA